MWWLIKDKEVRDSSLGAGGYGETRSSKRKREIEAIPTTNHKRMPRTGAESKSQHYRSPGCALVTSAQSSIPK